jgi:hypothetical protein
MLLVVCAAAANTLCKHSGVLSKHLIFNAFLLSADRVLFTTAAGKAIVKALSLLANVNWLSSKS